MESGVCTQCTTLVLEGLDLILSPVLMANVYSGKPDLVLVIPVTIFLIAAASFAFSLILGQKLKWQKDSKAVKFQQTCVPTAISINISCLFFTL